MGWSNTTTLLTSNFNRGNILQGYYALLMNATELVLTFVVSLKKGPGDLKQVLIEAEDKNNINPLQIIRKH